jgi:hypothetical protein
MSRTDPPEAALQRAVSGGSFPFYCFLEWCIEGLFNSF